MTIGDLVMFPPALGASVGSQDTVLGIVVAQAGAPVLASVMWQSTGKVTPAIPATELRSVHEGAFFNTFRVGSWEQLVAYPPAGGGGVPKSPAASGLVLDAFMLGDFESDPDESVAYVRFSINNGDGTLLMGQDPGPEGQVAFDPPADWILKNQPKRNS
jgi:hypothetical protein